MSDFWNERYGNEQDYAYGTEPNDFLRKEALNYIKAGGKVLCLAEGEGRNAVFLASEGYQCHCVDLSVTGLAKAHRLAKEKGVSPDLLTTQVVNLADEDAWVKEGEYDGIISIWCHLPDALRSKTHENVVKCLKKGGALVLEAYTPGNIGRGTGGPHQADMCMDQEKLRSDFRLDLVGAGSEMEAKVLKEEERNIKEGKYHEGLSAVVQLVAIKL